MQSIPQKPAKRARKSRFGSSVKPTVQQTQTPKPVADDPPPRPFFQNAAVALLRARTASARRPTQPESASKRRRTRFSAAQPGAPPAPPPLTFDVSAIPIAPVSTLRINRNAAQQRRVDKVLRVSEADLLDTDPRSNPYFDPKMRPPGRSRRMAQSEFRFVQQGDIVKKAQLQRENAVVQARTTEYRKRLAESGKEAEVLPVLPPLAEDLRPDSAVVDVPSCEWWDLPFLQRGANSGDVRLGDDGVGANDIAIREDRITHYIHHPPPISPAVPKKPPPVLPFMLTKKEAKKLRRQRRMEAQKEKQEMIAVGLLPPPPPKVKLSNVMRVLANEASADPTKIEADVRAQVEERRRKHEADNEARKKTKEERREKAHQKIEKDKEDGLHAVVFRVDNLQSSLHRFKINVNAKQLELSGSMLMFPDCNVVVAEGGAKALRKYKKLLLRRIDWNETITTTQSDEERKTPTESGDGEQVRNNEDQESNKCILVWEGPISVPSFTDFTTFSARTQRECRYHFRKHAVEHYWDLVTQASPVGNENLGVRQVEKDKV